MKKLEKLLNSYQKLDITPSIEDEKRLLYNYVYWSTKLEGNRLTLSQTIQLLSSDSISGNNIRVFDVLEQKGMYKALVLMLNSVQKKSKLSVELILKFNWAALSYLWNYDDAYIGAKNIGQLINDFKCSQNVIQINKGGQFLEDIIPLSTPKNVNENMNSLIDSINSSPKSILEKVAYLAQELWLHQPFVDGNKRTERLLINFLLMKEGYPLFVFDDDYNSIMIEQYYKGTPDLLKNYIEKKLSIQMKASIDKEKNIKPNTGFRMIL